MTSNDHEFPLLRSDNPCDYCIHQRNDEIGTCLPHDEGICTERNGFAKFYGKLVEIKTAKKQ